MYEYYGRSCNARRWFRFSFCLSTFLSLCECYVVPWPALPETDLRIKSYINDFLSISTSSCYHTPGSTAEVEIRSYEDKIELQRVPCYPMEFLISPAISAFIAPPSASQGRKRASVSARKAKKKGPTLSCVYECIVLTTFTAKRKSSKGDAVNDLNSHVHANPY